MNNEDKIVQAADTIDTDDTLDTEGEHGYGKNLEELADALAQQLSVPVDKLDEFRQALSLLTSSVVDKTKTLAEKGKIYAPIPQLTEVYTSHP